VRGDAHVMALLMAAAGACNTIAMALVLASMITSVALPTALYNTTLHITCAVANCNLTVVRYAVLNAVVAQSVLCVMLTIP
jgi:hypothetical protein